MYTKECQLQFKNIKGDVNDVIYFSTMLTIYAWNNIKYQFVKIILRVKCWNKNGNKQEKSKGWIEYHKKFSLDVQTSILIIL